MSMECFLPSALLFRAASIGLGGLGIPGESQAGADLHFSVGMLWAPPLWLFPGCCSCSWALCLFQSRKLSLGGGWIFSSPVCFSDHEKFCLQSSREPSLLFHFFLALHFSLGSFLWGAKVSCSVEIWSDELHVLFDRNNYALKVKLLMLIFRSPCCSGGLAAVPFPSVLCSGTCSFPWACESLVTIKIELFGTLLFSSTVKFKE